VALPAVAFIGYCAFTLPLSGGLAAEPTPTPRAVSLTAGNGQVFATRGIARGDLLPPQQQTLAASPAFAQRLSVVV